MLLIGPAPISAAASCVSMLVRVAPVSDFASACVDPEVPVTTTSSIYPMSGCSELFVFGSGAQAGRESSSVAAMRSTSSSSTSPSTASIASFAMYGGRARAGRLEQPFKPGRRVHFEDVPAVVPLDEVDAGVVEVHHVGRVQRCLRRFVGHVVGRVLDGAAERDVGPPVALGRVAVHRADDLVADDVHAQVAVFLVIAVDELLEERLPVPHLRVHALGEVDLPRSAAVRADRRLINSDLAEALAPLVEPVVRQREQRVRHADVPVGERRRRGELVD